jgi:uncharacterized oxidoreductase
MRIGHEALTNAAAAILTSAGAPAAHARLVAEHLVEANLKGHDSHGIGMVANYVHGMLKGLVHPERHASLVRDGGAILAFDGGVGLGRIVGMEAIDAGIERARVHGICCVALGNAAHLGRIGIFGERCAEAGFVSMHYVNVVGHDPGVVPFGGRDSRFVTNPFCCTVPRPDGEHVVLDMATTTIAMGKVRVAMMKGVPVPDGALVDESGNPTNDPAALFGAGRKGAMQPFGQHKGYGLMVMCELLGGALGGLYTMQPAQPRKGATINNMLSIIIDPGAAADRAAFDAEVTAMIEYIYSSRPAAGVESVLLPGDPERKSRARLLTDGIDIDENSWKVFLDAGKRAGVGADEIAALLRER